MESKKVIVTGAGGFIGSYITEELVIRGYEVIALDIADDKKIAHLKNHNNLKIIKSDILQFNKIVSLFGKEKIDCVFHVAALLQDDNNDPSPFFEVNARGTLNILEASRKTGVKKFIYSSSMSVYGKSKENLSVKENQITDPYDFYSLSKLMGEELCKLYSDQYGIKTAVLRYAGVYGPGRDSGAVADFIGRAKENKPIYIKENISWDLVFVKDVTRANILAFNKIESFEYETINIGSGKEINIIDVAKKSVEALNSASNIEFSPDFQKDPSLHFYFDISKAKKLLGFEPTDFEEGLKQYIQEVK